MVTQEVRAPTYKSGDRAQILCDCSRPQWNVLTLCSPYPTTFSCLGAPLHIFCIFTVTISVLNYYYATDWMCLLKMHISTRCGDRNLQFQHWPKGLRGAAGRMRASWLTWGTQQIQSQSGLHKTLSQDKARPIFADLTAQLIHFKPFLTYLLIISCVCAPVYAHGCIHVVTEWRSQDNTEWTALTFHSVDPRDWLLPGWAAGIF